jgi:hypothetical protein
MSFSFYVASPTLPRLGEVLDALPCDVRCTEETRSQEGDLFDRNAHWPDRRLHFYRDAISTCAVEVYWQDGQFQVRVFAFAVPEEYELALAFAECFARRAEAGIRPEDADELPFNEVRACYGPSWAATQVEALFSMLPVMVRQADSVCQLPGAVRPFYLGPRLLGELEAAGPAAELTSRLIEAMRRVQYVDPEEYFCGSAIEVSAKDSDESFTVAAWGPEVNYLFPSVDYLAVIEGEQGSHFMIPYEALPEVAGDRWRWLDEAQTLVEAFSPEEWPALLERARPHRVEPEGKRRARGRPPEE